MKKFILICSIFSYGIFCVNINLYAQKQSQDYFKKYSEEQINLKKSPLYRYHRLNKTNKKVAPTKYITLDELELIKKQENLKTKKTQSQKTFEQIQKKLEQNKKTNTIVSQVSTTSWTQYLHDNTDIPFYLKPKNQINSDKEIAQKLKIPQQFYDTEKRKQGIREIIGIGVTDFTNSSPARIYNIKTSIQKFDGLIIPQGEIFSFNETLGKVTDDEYLTESVLINGSPAKALGGGICQVSTTLFQSIYLAGLEVVERRNHSVSIPYYSPQGLDATIFLGIVDLKFKNNTNGDILLKIYIDEFLALDKPHQIDQKLYVVLYGSRDRFVKVEPIFWEGDPQKNLVVKWQRTIYKNKQEDKQDDKQEDKNISKDVSIDILVSRYRELQKFESTIQIESQSIQTKKPKHSLPEMFFNLFHKKDTK